MDRRLGWLAGALLLALLLVLATTWRRADAPAAGHPTERVGRPSRDARPVPAPAASDVAAAVTLVVPLGAWGVWEEHEGQVERLAFVDFSFDPAPLLPDPASLQDPGVAALAREVLALQDEPLAALDLDAIALPSASPADRPWLDLLELEVARLRAAQDAARARAAARAGGERSPLPERGALLAQAAAVAARWPAHPVGDVATLYELSVLGDAGTRSQDPHALARLGIELASRASDPTVRTLAGRLLLNAGSARLDLDADELDALWDLAGAGLDLPRHALDALGADAALRLEDDARAGRWIARWRTDLDQACAGDDASWCDTSLASLAAAEGYFAARTAPEAWSPTWQAAIRAVGRRCGEDVLEQVELRGRWEPATGWTWEADASAAGRCVRASTPRGPAPPGAVDLRLILVPRREVLRRSPR
ncbi:MAG: hypothetical protein R3F59_07205 [Myxococcota bacterium]